MDPRKSKRNSELAAKVPKASEVSKAKRSRPEEVIRFENLHEEMILKILTFLDIKDVVSVSQTCSRLKSIVDGRTAYWRKAFVDHGHERSEVLAEMAASRKTIDPTISVEKLNFLFQQKVQRNFARGRFKKAAFMTFSEPWLNYSSFGNVPAVLRVIISRLSFTLLFLVFLITTLSYCNLN